MTIKLWNVQHRSWRYWNILTFVSIVWIALYLPQKDTYKLLSKLHKPLLLFLLFMFLNGIFASASPCEVRDSPVRDSRPSGHDWHSALNSPPPFFIYLFLFYFFGGGGGAHFNLHGSEQQSALKQVVVLFLSIHGTKWEFYAAIFRDYELLLLHRWCMNYCYLLKDLWITVSYLNNVWITLT